MNSADNKVKKRKVECPDDTAQITAADEGSVSDIIAQMRSEINDVKKMCQSRIDEMENKCQTLETKCSSLERSIGILTKESKWEYSAPDIPMSYWIDKGYDDDYSDDMEELIEDMKSLTHALRRGRCNHISLGHYENGLVLFHDDILLPHWKELANALQLYQSKDISTIFSINAVQFESSVMELLAPALAGKFIGTISFKDIVYDEDKVRQGIEFAVKCIKSIKRLTEFKWTNNPIGSVQDALYLVDAVINHSSIDSFHLVNCLGGINGYNLLCHLLASRKSCKEIVFESDLIRTGGDTTIPDYIATNPPLEKLGLRNNGLNDNDAILIARALRNNTNLREIRLGENNLITEQGRNALINLVYDPTSLNSVADCNHTCCIKGIIFGSKGPNNSNCPTESKTRKIYHLLSERNKELSNTQHLNSEFDDEEEDSMKLVPKVLECVHSYSPPPLWKCRQCTLENSWDYLNCRMCNEPRPTKSAIDPVRPLSVMYEIIRSYKMPELYEHAGTL